MLRSLPGLLLALLPGALAPDPAAAPSDPGAHDPGSQGVAPYDLVVYGGTSAGVIAAVQARLDGLSVALVCPETRLGGLTSGGLGWTDTGDAGVIGGLSRGFYEDVHAHYARPEAWTHRPRARFLERPGAAHTIDDDTGTMWVFEPGVAAELYERRVARHDVPVFRGRWLDRESGVTLEGRRITALRTLSGETFAGRMFVDATYEGDLLAAAGVSYTVGRESNATYGETLNGNQPDAPSHQFQGDVSAYVVPGDPSSGLLPRAESGGAGQGRGERGAGDDRVQAYCFRLCLTNVPENRVPFPRPEGYDPGEYELLLRTLLAGSRHVFGKFDPMPNGKTDTNNSGPFSTDDIGRNHDYPEASYARRAEIAAEHRTYQQGFYHFLCTDPRVPEDVRTRMSEWGLSRDEFAQTGHWPGQLYVREARRMVSDFVVTEGHVRCVRPTPRPVGMGAYNMDSHHVRRYVDEGGFVRNEGDVQARLSSPYPIDYGALVPRRGECENLLVPVCVSASHIAFGSIRMEPVFMILGQSAAQAAALALELDVPVQDVPYGLLRERLLAAGQRLAEPTTTSLDAADLGPLGLDDADARLVGDWRPSSSVGPAIGGAYHHDGDAGKGERRAVFELAVPTPGSYEVRLAYPAHPNRASRVPVRIEHRGGATTVHVDQRARPELEGRFTSLGVHDFGDRAVVEVRTEGTDGYVVVDAVLLVPVGGAGDGDGDRDR